MWNSYSKRATTNTISLKPFIIAFFLIPLNSYWLMQLETVRRTIVSQIVPLSSVIFVLLILTVFNRLLQKIFPAIALNQAELLIIYIILSLATMLGSMVVVGRVIPIIGHAFWFATPENEWKELFWRYIPEWLTIDNRSVLRGYYEGNSSLYTARHLKAWLSPILWWSSIIFTLGFTMLCMNTVIRRQWSEREKLTYPTVRLPMELTKPKLAFFKNRLMWIGFGIAAFISLINGLRFFYPSLPFIPVTRRSYRFYDGPLSLIGSNSPGKTTIAFYPFALGIGFLMPLEVMGSTLFFFLFYRFQDAFGTLTGYKELYQTEQFFGSLVGLFILLVWMGRRHLVAVVRTAFGSRNKLDDSEEPMRYRTAVLGAAFGLIMTSYFLYRGGMSPWVILIFLFLYFLLPFVITRIRAESGIYVHNFEDQSPQYVIRQLLGTRPLGTRNSAAIAVSFLTHGYTAQMPHQLEALHIAKQNSIGKKPLLVSILLTIVLGTVIAFFVELSVYYKIGAESGYFSSLALGPGENAFEWLQDVVVSPVTWNSTAVSFMGMGLFFLLFVAYMRIRFIWWPFHPIGLMMAGNEEMEDLWLPILLCWILKASILKYGGHKMYRRAVPFFLGLALGDFTLGSIWSILGTILNSNVYVYYP